MRRRCRRNADVPARTRRLWRAAEHEYLYEACCFCSTMRHAQAYLGMPTGYGGEILYSAVVEYDPRRVLDVRDTSDARQLAALVRAAEDDEPGAVTADYYVMQGRVVDRLVRSGYHWVRLLDTYPQGAETWVWLNHPDAIEPELEPT